MLRLLLLLCTIPAAACIWIRVTRGPRGVAWLGPATRVVGLFAVGLSAACPFITTTMVGTGEAYNYSLALADAVTQMRAGEIPPLVGQTEYAFNGRVHPLRNAPYLFYVGAAWDLLALRSLPWWQLQNLTIAASLIGAVFAAYASLRWGTGCMRLTAFFFAAFYGLSPALLGAVHAQDLFMTVHASPFIPVALAACAHQSRRTSLAADVILAGAVASTWLAHPPTAMWLTLATGVIRVLLWLRKPSRSATAGLLAGGLVFAALTLFVFVSVHTLAPAGTKLPSGEEAKADFTAHVLKTVSESFPGALLPVSPRAEHLSDFQLGYTAWALLVASFIALFRQSKTSDSKVAGALFLAMSTVALGFLLPIPGITAFLWRSLPTPLAMITGVWPMQRLYAVVIGTVLFAAALLLFAPTVTRRGRAFTTALLCLGAAWTTYQALPFLHRGMRNRNIESRVAPAYAPSNRDLTVVSYAFLGIPPTFNNGHMDPVMEVALSNSTQQRLWTNYDAALEGSREVTRGSLVEGSTKPEIVLQPQKKYLLHFIFLVPSAEGTIRLNGTTLDRVYILSNSGAPRRLGMGPGHRHAVPIWTDLKEPERVALNFAFNHPDPANAGRSVAHYVLRKIDTSTMPARVESLLPLRIALNSPEDLCYLETFRRFVPGYEATVNGRATRPVPSPDGNVMIPLPKGPCIVTVTFHGPPLLRAAFWVSACSYVGLSLGLMAWATRRPSPVKLTLRPIGSRAVFRAVTTAAVSAALAGLVITLWIRNERYLESCGPIAIDFTLPADQTGRQQPLLTTGRSGAGSIVFLAFVDKQHVRVGADIWGAVYYSDPVELDYTQTQQLVVSASGLYPTGHPRLRHLPPGTLQTLRQQCRVELNGRPVLSLDRDAYESTVEQITLGETKIGGSYCEPVFRGVIHSARRLPIPSLQVVQPTQPLTIRARFPRGQETVVEPLVAFGVDGRAGTLSARYEEGSRVRLIFQRADGAQEHSHSISFQPDRTLHFQLYASNPDFRNPSIAIQAFAQNRRLLGPAQLPVSAAPVVASIGINKGGVSDVAPRFTGAQLDASSPIATPRTAGPARLLVSFPMNRSGQREPLLVTGRTGAGNLLFVIYTDDRHIQLGFDHWAHSATLTEPIAIDYAVPHLLVVDHAGLYPSHRDGAHPTSITFDGQPVLVDAPPAYSAQAREFFPGANPIGGSSCGPSFSGILWATERLPSPERSSLPNP